MRFAKLGPNAIWVVDNELRTMGGQPTAKLRGGEVDPDGLEQHGRELVWLSLNRWSGTGRLMLTQPWEDQDKIDEPRLELVIHNPCSFDTETSSRSIRITPSRYRWRLLDHRVRQRRGRQELAIQ